jgi:hypothetical protein
VARRFLVLVTLPFLGCAEPLPKALYIESRFTEEEAGAIATAIEEVNRSLGEGLLGRPALMYEGRFHDSDGFTADDFSDGIHAVYKVSRDSPEYGWLLEVTTRKRFRGYATLADVLFFVDPEDLAFSGYRPLMLHELGHFIGMSHSPDPGAVMHTPPGADAYTESDKEAFCLIYRCK